MKRLFGILWGCTALVWLSSALSGQAPPQPVQTVGNETCVACHEDIGKAFEKNPHAVAKPGRRALPSAGQCESCHGPGGAHAENPTKENILSLRSLSALDSTERCLTCHSKQRAHMNWAASAHADGKVGCLSCHSVHNSPAGAPKLLSRVRTTDVCLKCHANLTRSLTQRSRHPMLEGKMDCASCHDPHGSVTEKLVRAKSVNELCYTCHAEKRGPHLWEHSPVKESCTNCHTPHGSNFESLLVMQTSRLCQQCHIQGRHQTLAGMRNEPWVVGRACVNCHPKIHGSNSPSGPLFQR